MPSVAHACAISSPPGASGERPVGRVLGRIQVQPDHVQQLVLEARVARELEGARRMRLEAVALPPFSGDDGDISDQEESDPHSWLDPSVNC
jgi:hypothetical protein